MMFDIFSIFITQFGHNHAKTLINKVCFPKGNLHCHDYKY